MSHIEIQETLSTAESRLERLRRRSGLVLSPLAFGFFYWMTEGSVSPEGQRLSAIIGATAVLWMTETIPIPAAALLGACLSAVLGVADAKTVLAPFGDPIVFLFIGSFMLSRAMMVHQLDRRIAFAFLSLPGVARHPAGILAAVGLIAGFISMWVSNTATTAMMMPIAFGIVQAMAEADARANGDRAVCSGILNTPYATGVMLMVAYGASIGGIGTPVGSPPNLITLGLLRKLAAVDFDFFSWMRLMIPMLTVMGVVLFGLLYLLHRPGKRITQACQALPEFVNQQRRDLGAWTRGELNTAVAFFVAVVLWVLPGVVALVLGKEAPLAVFLTTRFTEATAALIAALLLFILPINLREERFTLSWSQAAQIDWGTIILFGGGLSLGSLMFQTGVAEAFGKFVTGITGPTSVWGLTAVAAGFAIILSETTSNTAASNMVVPVVIVLAQQSGLNPLIPALGACLGASFGFMLPVSTPPNAIAYGTGLVPILSMVRAGLLFDIVGWIVIVGGMRVLCPLLGIQ